MATTTIDNRTTTDNRLFYWSIAVIIAVALAIVFTVRQTSLPDTSPGVFDQSMPSAPTPPTPTLDR